MLKKLLSSVLISVILSILLVSCKDTAKKEGSDTEVSLDFPENAIPKAEDLGQEYIDKFIFLGESTTYHLKNRGVLSDGTETKQVWGPKSGTLMLDLTTADCRIVYPPTSEEMDLCEAMKKERPEYMLLTFGLNGATKTVSRGKEYFRLCYSKLIRALREASPNTTVIIQSCFPIAASMDMSKYTVDAKTLNEYINIINVWASELADELSLGYLNSCEVLKDDKGFLREEFQAGDGHHLTREAYVEILKYIRTHPYRNEVKE